MFCTAKYNVEHYKTWKKKHKKHCFILVFSLPFCICWYFGYHLCPECSGPKVIQLFFHAHLSWAWNSSANKYENANNSWHFHIGIKHGFSCINIRQVLWEVLKTEAEARGSQHLPTDLGNVNALKKHVRSLLLHKNWKHLLHFALFLALFWFAFSPICRECNLHGLCSF